MPCPIGENCPRLDRGQPQITSRIEGSQREKRRPLNYCLSHELGTLTQSDLVSGTVFA